MKSQISHPIFYILLQVLGIWVDGVMGIGFEMMAVLIFSIGKKRNLESLFRQGTLIVGVEILIDLFCGNAEMIFETGFWFLEEMRRVILNLSWVLIPTFIFMFCFFQKENILRTPQLLIDKISSKFDVVLTLPSFDCSIFQIASPPKYLL